MTRENDDETASVMHEMGFGCRTDYRGDIDCGGSVWHRASARLFDERRSVQRVLAVDVERLGEAMLDTDPRCAWFPGGCCAPPTHANAEEIAARYNALSDPFYCVACGDLLPREAAYCAEHAHLGDPA